MFFTQNLFKKLSKKLVDQVKWHLNFWPRDDLDRHDGPSSSSEISFFKRFCSIINEEHFLEEDNFFPSSKENVILKTRHKWRRNWQYNFFLKKDFERLWNVLKDYVRSWKILKYFEKFWKILKHFKDFARS